MIESNSQIAPTDALNTEAFAQAVMESHSALLPEIDITVIPAFLLRDGYDNAAVIRGVTSPILIIHGNADDLVPLESGRRLAAVSGGKLEIVEGGHDVFYGPEVQQHMIEWLDAPLPKGRRISRAKSDS